jgi:RNA polymerase sigma-70 factor, ECF subfamily
MEFQRTTMSDQFKAELLALLPRLRRYALARSGNAAQADDMVQATCERAWRARDSLLPGARMDFWTFRIMKNLHIDEIRSDSARGIDVGPEALEEIPDHQWARRVEGRLTLEQVSHAMQQMPEYMRDVLALVPIEGLSYREAAEVLGVPVGTVMSRLARARADLMSRLHLDGDWADGRLA